MLKKYHIEICKRALGSTFSSRALEVIIKANFGQDHIRYQLRHPHFHFDSNAFEASHRYIEQQRWIVLDTLRASGEPLSAWEAFGRLSHTVQDFYAHTNYVRLWIAAHTNGDVPSPPAIGALDPEILQHPDLHSGNVYFWDWLAFIPGFHDLALRLTPKDSHTHMNLDHPGRGVLFPYAFEAAIQRTVLAFEQIAVQLTVTELANFVDR
jgi:hypothetical protein